MDTPDPLQKIREQYEKTIPEKLSHLRGLIDQLKLSKTREALEALRFAVHKMAGNAGTYGYAKVSEICKRWEGEILARIDPLKLDSNWLSQLETYFQDIQTGYRTNG